MYKLAVMKTYVNKNNVKYIYMCSLLRFFVF